MSAFEDYTYGYGGSSITLRPFVLAPNAERPDMMGAYMRVDVINVQSFPPEVFIWEAFSTFDNANTLVGDQRPACVAKPSDLGTYPINKPDSSRTDMPPFFRLKWFEATFSSPDLLLDTWERIKRDVKDLLKSTVDMGGP